MPYPGLLHPEPLLCSSPLLTRTPTGDTQTQFCLSLCGVFWCTEDFVYALQVSLASMGFDSKCNFSPPTILLELLLCLWMWGVFLRWDPTFFFQWLFSSELKFWSSHVRKWAHVLLLCHLDNHKKLYIRSIWRTLLKNRLKILKNI